MGFYALDSGPSCCSLILLLLVTECLSAVWFSRLLSICFRTCTGLDSAELCGPSCTEFLSSLLEGAFVIAA